MVDRPTGNPRPARVVVADDDPLLRGLLEGLLRRAGYEVQSRGDGRLQGIDLSAVDLVVTDCFMPERDGLEVLSRLRTEAPHVRKIAMTGDPHRAGEGRGRP